MSAPDAAHLLAEAVAAVDDACSADAVLSALARGLRSLTDADGTAVLRRTDGTWEVHAAAGVPGLSAVPVGWSDAAEAVHDGASVAPVPACDDLSPAVLLAVTGVQATVAVAVVLPAGAQPAPGSPAAALVEVLCRHAGMHVARLDDAAVRDDLLAQRATAMSTLARLADTDALTGVANRAGVFRVLSSLTSRSQHVGVVLIDLDGFKSVNDDHGHPTGDAVLRAVATRLAGVVRPTDTFGRLGGDEFLVVVRQTDTAGLAGLVQRIDAALEEPVEAGDVMVQVGASCGFALSSGHRSAADLLRAADQAMYDRKRSGRRSAAGAVIELHPAPVAD